MNKWPCAVIASAVLCGAAFAQAPVDKPVRFRGTVQSFSGTSMVVKDRGGEIVTLTTPEGVRINEVVPIELSAIKAGSFIGTGAMPAADGTLTAIEVHVFPESARGTGEGFRSWDGQPGATMTNATVADVVAAPEGRTLKVRYKDGEKTIVVPQGVPVVTFKPGERSLLVSGAKVVVTARMESGAPTALSISVGRDGFAPPM